MIKSVLFDELDHAVIFQFSGVARSRYLTIHWGRCYTL